MLRKSASPEAETESGAEHHPFTSADQCRRQRTEVRLPEQPSERGECCLRASGRLGNGVQRAADEGQPGHDEPKRGETAQGRENASGLTTRMERPALR